jgi:hypothetical protein
MIGPTIFSILLQHHILRRVLKYVLDNGPGPREEDAIRMTIQLFESTGIKAV